jgi:hypothetical protein
MLRSYAPFAALALGLVSWSPCPADDKSPGRGKDRSDAQFLDGTLRLLNIPGIGTNIEADRKAGTVLFDSLLTAAGGRSGPAVGTTTHTVACRLEGNDKPVCIVQDIRGFASASEKANVALVVHAGGKTTVIDLVKARVKDNAPLDPKKVKKREDRKNVLGEGFNFEYRMEVTVPANSDYQVTFFLVAERHGKDENDGAMVQVDSLDFVIQK